MPQLQTELSLVGARHWPSDSRPSRQWRQANRCRAPRLCLRPCRNTLRSRHRSEKARRRSGRSSDPRELSERSSDVCPNDRRRYSRENEQSRESRIEDGNSRSSIIHPRSSTRITMSRRIIVIGGGIAGLAAAHRITELNQSNAQKIDVLLVEAAA